MSTRWLISVPVWGERYVDSFCATALPALQRAVAALSQKHAVDARLIVHTDQPERVRGATDLAVEARPVPAGARYFDSMSQGHREVLALGMLGDVVVLLTAGAVISEEGLLYCAERFQDNGQLRVVLCAVPRVLEQGQLPDTASAPALMAWAWDNRHPMTRECTWPDGRSADLSRTFFVSGDAVVTRQALPHPLAVKIDGRVLRFTPTVDTNLIHCFDRSEMHVALDCRQLAVLKLSAADRGFQLADLTMAERAAAGMFTIADPHQRWCMEHRVLLCGAGQDYGDEQFMASVREGGG